MRRKRKVSALLNGKLAFGSHIEEIFTDIRTAPNIPLSHILLDVALMPLLEIKSLLKLDFYSRLPWFKRLFRGKSGERRLVCSDSTVQRVEISWIVTTDFSLSAAELREAAHVRWSIENNVFKKLSGLVKTKRFHFKEQRPFLSLLRIICGALAAYDLTLLMMREGDSQIKGFLGPLKWTYGIVYTLIFFSLEEGCFG